MGLTPHTESLAEDTIAAISTGVGGSIAIIRLSGPEALAIAGKVWHGRRDLGAFPARTMALGRVLNEAGETLDQCLAAYMPAPHSYTGEDIVEFQCHGGQLVARTVLADLLRHGARHAEPGEFSRRAFLNGRMDLTQAEAVLDIIQAHSEMALHVANRQLAGHLGRKIDEAYELLTTLLAEIEARLDFVDEDLDWEPGETLQARLDQARGVVRDLLAHREEGEILRHGIRLAIAGAPNVGKSSLLNLILGRDRAIVTEIPGTTRDTVEELAHIRGIPVQLVDTAGIREADDLIERQGVERGLAAIRQARIVLWVIDATQPLAPQRLGSAPLEGKQLIAIANKMDLVDELDFADDVPPPLIEMSALTGEGLPALYDCIEELVWGQPHAEEPEVAVSARHAALLADAEAALAETRPLLDGEEHELIAVNLRLALDALGRITGKTAEPDLLDHVFSKFCIGK